MSSSATPIHSLFLSLSNFLRETAILMISSSLPFIQALVHYNVVSSPQYFIDTTFAKITNEFLIAKHNYIL